jgi:hypothetical protein
MQMLKNGEARITSTRIHVISYGVPKEFSLKKMHALHFTIPSTNIEYFEHRFREVETTGSKLRATVHHENPPATCLRH